MSLLVFSILIFSKDKESNFLSSFTRKNFVTFFNFLLKEESSILWQIFYTKIFKTFAL